MNRIRREGGFTLVSVMVALIMVSVGLLALARAQAAMVASQGNLANRTVALTIARDYTEVIRSRDPATLVTEAAVNVDRQGVVTPSGVYARSTTITQLAPNLLQVQVFVTYPRSQTPVEIITIIYRSI